MRSARPRGRPGSPRRRIALARTAPRPAPRSRCPARAGGSLALRQLPGAPSLQADVVVVVEVVDPQHPEALVEQPLRSLVADEPGRAGQKHAALRHDRALRWMPRAEKPICRLA